MKHRTATLEGALLDAATAKAGRLSWQMEDRGLGLMCFWLNPDPGWKDGPIWMPFQPSLDWRYGGPIIERERITLVENGGTWAAFCSPCVTRNIVDWLPDGVGPTALIAAMRAYVASKFGEEVELP